MNNMNDYLQRRAAELGLERGGQLTAIQAYLDGLYPNQCRAVSLNDGVLKITTPNSSVASELRMRQVEVLRDLMAIDSSQSITRLIFTVA